MHEFCAGGGCCPVLVEYADGSLAIVDNGRELVSLTPDTAARLEESLRRLRCQRSLESRS
jgi:hypothetical protein